MSIFAPQPISIMLLPHHYPKSVFTLVTNDLHAIKSKICFQSLSYLTAQWPLTLFTTSSLLRHFLLFACCFCFSPTSLRTLSWFCFELIFFSNWLLNVGDLRSCLNFSLYAFSLGNLMHGHGMYMLCLYLYWDDWNTTQIQYIQDQIYGLLPEIWFSTSFPLFSEWHPQLSSYAIQKHRSHSWQRLSHISSHH